MKKLDILFYILNFKQFYCYTRLECISLITKIIWVSNGYQTIVKNGDFKM